MIKKMLTLTLMMSWCLIGLGQEDAEKEIQKMRPFIAYELGEAAFNKFQSYSGEIGIRFPNKHLLRLTHMNVKLTEEHLSSSFAGAVDGSDVEGSFFGFEAFYDFPLVWNTLYVAPSVGYYKNEYNHTILEESIKNSSTTIGLGLSYRETNLFGTGLYYTFSIPLRISLNPIKDTKMGNTTITNDTFNNNIWFFIGFEF